MKNIVNLGNVATYINGYAFKPSDWAEDGTPIIRIQDLTGNSYQMNRFKGIVDSKYEVNNGDVLISWSASLGVYIWNRGDAVLNQHIFKVVFDKVELDKDFFVFQVDNLLKRAANQAHGATMRHLTKPVFDALPFYLPDIKTQRLISSKLSLIGHLIEDHHNQLKKFDELIRSRFLEMFGNMIHVSSGFREMTLEEVCRKNGDVRCGPFGTQLSKSDYLDSGVPVWGIPEINSGFQIRASDYISKEKANLLSLYSIISGDIVMSRKGNVGKCEIYPSGYPVGIMHSDVLRIRVNKDLVNPTFLKYQFHFSERIKHQIGIVSHGAIMAGINVTKLKNINVLLPAINRQNQFSEFIHQVDKSKMAVQKSLDELETLKKSLMQTYFG